MTAYVEECRQEWKRLGVPDLLADEMATDLEADLAEAQADGISAAEILGESDPRRFAAAWARERGLVDEPPPERRHRRRWIWATVGFALALVFVVVLGLFAAVGVSVHTHVSGPGPQTLRSVVIPSFIGMKACHAREIGLESGLQVERIPSRRCDAVVVAQQPVRGTLIPLPQRRRIIVTLRLRG